MSENLHHQASFSRFSPSPQDHVFWGKFDQANGRSLPLSAHCLDVALTFRMLVDLPGFRRALETCAGRKLDACQLDRLAVIAALHDAGKTGLGFQLKVFDPKAIKAGHIRELEAIFDDQELLERFCTAIRWDRLVSWFCDEQAGESYLLAAWSHHGRPLCFKGETAGTFHLAKDRWWRPQGSWDPMEAIAEIMTWAERAFPEAFAEGGTPLPDRPGFQHRFAGLLMLADWLGSHPLWFPIERATLENRLRRDREILLHLFQSVGLDVQVLRPVVNRLPPDFQSRFGLPPRPLQSLVDLLDPQDPRSRLLIAESETGSGKTEAAYHWFCRLFAAGKVDSLYFALPTRVAARELYLRIVNHGERFFPDPEKRPVTVLAVPGYAQVDGFPVCRLLPDRAECCAEDEVQSRRERCWAGEHPKRFLAATVAVGTVDQAIFSIIQTAHAHLRSACLDRSLLVIDEVHASDAYMDQLLAALLTHHLSAGGYALLLSATLGARARSLFLGTCSSVSCVPDPEQAMASAYPCLTLGSGRTIAAQATSGTAKTVDFELLGWAQQPEQILDRIAAALQQGARILVILNTVARVQTFLRAAEAHPVVRARLFACEGVVCPHHGRFAPSDRARLDRAVSERFGPKSQPGPVLLIGSQTLEQSLDIDADWMITDLCPADVLLQRIGRLHRHDRLRPPSFQAARCTVLIPEQQDLIDAIDPHGNVKGSYKRLGYGNVYEDLRILERTRRALAARPTIEIPRDNRFLVEQATHPELLRELQGESWDQHAQQVEGSTIMRELAAANAIAVYNKPFGETSFSDAGTRVASRLGLDSLQLPLDRPLPGPFGRTLEEMVIPGHMAPKETTEVITVESAEPAGEAVLKCGKRRYRYGRYGLEVTS